MLSDYAFDWLLEDAIEALQAIENKKEPIEGGL